MNAIRSRHERVIQTLWFEALGLAIMSPLYSHFAGVSAGEPLIHLIVALTTLGWLEAIVADIGQCTPQVATD